MWGFLSALISGALMSIQGVFNTNVTKQTSLWVSTGWVQFSAFLVCVLAWIFTGRDSVGALWQVENKYTLLGGVIGAFITVTVIQSMSSLGPAMNWDAFAFAELLLTQPLHIVIGGGTPGAFGSYRDGFELFGRARSQQKRLQIVEGASHYDLYDQPDATGQALAQIVPFFRQHLAQA